MTSRFRHLWPGAPFAVASAVLFGISTPLAKVLLGDLPPAMLAGLLYLGSGLGLLAMLQIGRGSRSANEARLRRPDLPWLAAVVLTGGVLGPLLLMAGLAATPASAASLLLNLESVFTLSIAWMVFHENVDRRIGMGALAIVLASVLLSWSGRTPGYNWRSLAIVGACLAWGIDNNLTRRLSGADPVQLAMIKGLAAGSVNLALALILLRGRWPSLMLVASAAGVGFVGYGLSLMYFILALRHLGAARTSAYFSFAPFVGAAASFLALAEPLTSRFLVAAGLMAGGLYLHLSERHDHVHAHERIAHEHRHVHDEHHQHAHSAADPRGEPHAHWHEHAPFAHSHPHYPDLHHRHWH